MNEWKARQTICEVGKRLYNRGFAAANDGNITIRLDKNLVLCTPTGVSKGFMKPDDLCLIDLEGNQLSGKFRRSSEALLHLSIYKSRNDINGVVHCHPPHATAFAIAHEPIPKCVLPEVEVFLGEVPISPYETPGTQRFADTILPYVNDCNIIILANHGTVAFHENLMTAYFNTEIIDAYCRMLLLARQLGPLNYMGEKHVGELLEMKERLGIDDPRLNMEDCDLCGNSLFREGYTDFVPQPKAFAPPAGSNSCSGVTPRAKQSAVSGQQSAVSSEAYGKAMSEQGPDLEALVRTITDQVMQHLGQTESS